MNGRAASTHSRLALAQFPNSGCVLATHHGVLDGRARTSLAALQPQMWSPQAETETVTRPPSSFSHSAFLPVGRVGEKVAI